MSNDNVLFYINVTVIYNSLIGIVGISYVCTTDR